MGVFSTILSKIEAKVLLYRDGSHAYPKELLSKDERPHIDPSAPTPSPAKDIHAENCAHRRYFRSQRARQSDLRHELPVPDESETWIGGQQRDYAREQQQQQPRRESTGNEQRSGHLYESAEPNRGESTEAERPAHTTQASHRQESDDARPVDNLVDPGQHSHHLCFHGPQDARANAEVETQDGSVTDLSMHNIGRATGIVMGARTARERDHEPVKIGAANLKHIHRKKSDRERKEGEVRSERDIVEHSEHERSGTGDGNQVLQASDIEHDIVERQHEGGETSIGAMTGQPVEESP